MKKCFAKINDYIFEVGIAETLEQRHRGLRFIKEMPVDMGLLLDFKRGDEFILIEMVDCEFNLDLIFLSENLVVTYVEEDAQAKSPNLYPSQNPARYCLEINAGLVSAFDIKPGDRLLVTDRLSEQAELTNALTWLGMDVKTIVEHLGRKATVKTYIDDFLRSNNPRFRGKGKKERIRMAVAAAYAAHRTNEQDTIGLEMSEQSFSQFDKTSKPAYNPFQKPNKALRPQKIRKVKPLAAPKTPKKFPQDLQSEQDTMSIALGSHPSLSGTTRGTKDRPPITKNQRVPIKASMVKGWQKRRPKPVYELGPIRAMKLKPDLRNPKDRRVTRPSMPADRKRRTYKDTETQRVFTGRRNSQPDRIGSGPSSRQTLPRISSAVFGGGAG